MSPGKRRSYGSWVAMKTRCYSLSGRFWENYGKRGITFCERWRSFSHFFEDMGERPVGFSIDRIDNNGNYEPSNCIWATSKTQANNRRPMPSDFSERIKVGHRWARKMGRIPGRLVRLEPKE